MTPDYTAPLADSGHVLYVTGTAAAEFARFTGRPPEESRVRLTELLCDAKFVEPGPPERWRHRSRSSGLDILAHVTREGDLAKVVHVHPRRGR